MRPCIAVLPRGHDDRRAAVGSGRDAPDVAARGGVGAVSLPTGAGLLLLLLACGGEAQSGPDAAGEAAARELVEQHFGPERNAPWEVVCLGRDEDFGEEPEADFLRRFEDDEPPVVARSGCAAADEDSRWVVEGTGRTALDLRLREAEQTAADELLVEASVSGGPADFAMYECTLVRREAGWEVEECVATVMT